MLLPESVRWLPLTGVAEVVGDAKVVAIGENNHYIREFGLLRDRLLRLLVTELGFTVLAYESGFAEGELADAWIRGAPGEPEVLARNGFTFRFGEPAEVRGMLGWLREHNRSNGNRVRFAGLDLPGAGGSPVPALAKVRDYLGRRTELVDAALEATEPYHAANNSVALARYSELAHAERDAATAALARLLLYLDAMPDGGPEHLIARHHALGALRLDEHLREFTLLGTEPPAKVVSSRDVYHAETVRLLRRLHGPDARIVLMMHNAHIQRVPMELLPGIHADSAGTHLAGPDYVAIAVTATVGTTTDTELNENAPQGFDVVPHPAGPPAEDSIEAAVAGEEPVLLDLRAARAATGLPTLRTTRPISPPDAERLDATLPDAGSADAGLSSSEVADAGRPDSGVADAGRPNAGLPGAGLADAGPAAPGLADAGLPESRRPAPGMAVAGLPDLGVAVARHPNPGVADAGRPDAGVADAGPRGAALHDSGAADAGPRDAGPRDAGRPAAGPSTPAPPTPGLPATGLPAKIRHVTTHLAVDLPAAFDAIACLPEMTPATLTTPDRSGQNGVPDRFE
ncbi:erythromycin esterase family protein [Amycolatopsis albispora]|uniref:erythromycin esterase family protein n=1 Tax=Amycolatopsis albispora TaxID=1804986 RepID=UPI0013B4601E|nr:erythromycin esterase family protein [Amycolatopsis albispora]